MALAVHCLKEVISEKEEIFQLASIGDMAEISIPLQASTDVRPGEAGEFLSGASPIIKGLERAAKDVANSSMPVLISGEPGTGKRGLGLQLHRFSRTSAARLAEVECRELRPDHFLEEIQDQFAPQHVSTVLLHEVSDLDSSTQAKLCEIISYLLRRPDNGGFAPRMVFTTHRNLEHEVKLGRFREDFYYLIGGITLRVPPLRHRKEDIAILIDLFLSKYATLLHRPKPFLSEAAMKSLGEYSWPGNVRELEDAARTIAAIGDEKIALSALRSTQRAVRRQNGKVRDVSLKEASRAASRAAERDLILRVLGRTQWNRKRAAEELKISYKALLYKLKEIGVTDPNSLPEGEPR